MMSMCGFLSLALNIVSVLGDSTDSWSRGYDVAFTRRRSPVQIRLGPPSLILLISASVLVGTLIAPDPNHRPSWQWTYPISRRPKRVASTRKRSCSSSRARRRTIPATSADSRWPRGTSSPSTVPSTSRSSSASSRNPRRGSWWRRSPRPSRRWRHGRSHPSRRGHPTSRRS